MLLRQMKRKNGPTKRNDAAMQNPLPSSMPVALDAWQFRESQKLAAFERQKGKCPLCGKAFTLEEMHADHIVPWSRGGRTTAENCQMLCHACNFTKGGK